MDYEYIRCAQCGHDFPVSLVLTRDYVECACGMRIESDRGPALRPGPSALALLLLAIAAVLLTAVAALAHRLAP